MGSARSNTFFAVTFISISLTIIISHLTGHDEDGEAQGHPRNIGDHEGAHTSHDKQ